MKQVFWIGDSKDILCSFPEDVKDEAGSALRRIQYGQTPKNTRPLANMARGVRGVLEIILDHDKETYRVVYVAKLSRGVYVLHAFHKKSKSGIGIPPKDKELIVARYKMAVAHDEA